MVRSLVLVALAWLPAASRAHVAPSSAAPADSFALDFATPDSTFFSAADSIWGLTEPVIVIGAPAGRSADPAATAVDAVTISARDARSVADLGPLLPATKVNVNSRGESLFSVRGAPERHVRVFLDGVPLNVPWDERADLSMVPADAIGSLRAVRGVGGVLDGPNALGGTLDLLPPTLPGDGRRTRLGLRYGESRAWEARALHQQAAGAWQWLAAAARREQDGWIVPEGLDAPFNQGEGRERLNSDLAQSSLLLRAQRELRGGGTLRLLLVASDGEKGVPPETHLDDGARYWRYPVARRGLFAASLDRPASGARPWGLSASVAGDLSRQEIRQYDDATFTTPELAPGVDYETDRDRTAYARAGTTRRLGADASVAVQGIARYTHHRESLVKDGPELAYAQWLTSLVAEGAAKPARDWSLRAGAGWERAATGETGDKPARNAIDAVVAHARVQRDFGDGLALHAAVSRRSRFPALRELYSGALGRFVPNPALMPERQDLLETGAVARGANWEAGLTGFAGRLRDGIERVALDDLTYQRVNIDEIRVLGVETVMAWRPAPAWSISAHHTLLHVRREVDGAWSGPLEDRPSYLAFASLTWLAPGDFRLAVEGAAVGPRESVDVTDEVDGLRRLPAGATLGARAGWTWRVPPAGLSRVELYLRVSNVFDEAIDSQTGLPEPGRMIAVGANAWFDAWER